MAEPSGGKGPNLHPERSSAGAKSKDAKPLHRDDDASVHPERSSAGAKSKDAKSPHRDDDQDLSVSAVFRSSFPPQGHGFRSGAWRLGVAKTADELVPLYPTMLHALSSAAKLSGDIGITLLAEDEDDPPKLLTYAQLYEQVRATQERLEKEVRFAQRVQAALLPAGPPKRLKPTKSAGR